MDHKDDKMFVIEHHDETADDGGSRVLVSFEQGTDRATLVREERTLDGAWRESDEIEVTQSALEAALRHMRNQKLLRADAKFATDAAPASTTSERINLSVMKRVTRGVRRLTDMIANGESPFLIANELLLLGDLGPMIDAKPAQARVAYDANARARRIAGLCEKDDCANTSQVDSVLCEQHELELDAKLDDVLREKLREGDS